MSRRGTAQSASTTSSSGCCGQPDDRQQQQQPAAFNNFHRRQPIWRRSSCLHLLLYLIEWVLPIVGSFRGYSPRRDLFTDLSAGLTVAIMHIPQGMAYGLLAGVDPIYGLYVSFVPVLVMALMSKSRHVSYGTFAIISMLLMNSIDTVRLATQQQQLSSSSPLIGLQVITNDTLATDTGAPLGNRLAGLVLTDNHQPPGGGGLADARAQQLLKSLPITGPPTQPAVQQANNASAHLEGPELGATAGQPPPPLLVIEQPTNLEILTCVCFVCGLIHVTMALLRMGALSLVFSDQLVSAFTTGSAIHVITSQLFNLFDLEAPGQLTAQASETLKLFRTWYLFLETLLQARTATFTGLMSLASIGFLVLVKELIEPRLRRRFVAFTCLPSELLLLVAVTLSSWCWHFNESFGVKIIGFVPSELPRAQLPPARLDLIPLVLQDALTIALVSFAMNLSLAQVYAKQYRYKLDANQELLALGGANLVGSLFSCFPCASSLSRSAVQSSFNPRSQLPALISCSIVVLIICQFSACLYHLPRSTLSCIIVVALRGVLSQCRDLYSNWVLSKLDALIWLATFVTVLVFGVTYGLLCGILVSLLMIFYRLLTPNYSLLGRLPGTDIYVDLEAFAHCQEIHQVKIFRFNSPLCYLNRTLLRARIERLLPEVYPPTGLRALICARQQQFATNNLSPVTSLTMKHHHQQQQQPSMSTATATRYLIIDCSALAYCDCSGLATLVDLIEELEERQLHVYLAACPLKLIDLLERMQKVQILETNVYPTIADAIGKIQYRLRQLEQASAKEPQPSS